MYKNYLSDPFVVCGRYRRFADTSHNTTASSVIKKCVLLSVNACFGTYKSQCSDRRIHAIRVLLLPLYFLECFAKWTGAQLVQYFPDVGLWPRWPRQLAKRGFHIRVLAHALCHQIQQFVSRTVWTVRLRLQMLEWAFCKFSKANWFEFNYKSGK